MKNYLVLGIVFVLTGLTMLLIPAGFIKAVVVSLGVAAVANGLYIFFKTRLLVDDYLYRRAYTLRAGICFLCGLIAIVFPLILAGTLWFAVSYILAAGLLLSAVIEGYGVYMLRREGQVVTAWWYEIGVSVFLALVLIIFPGSVGLSLVRISGILVLLGGAGVIAWSLGVFGKRSTPFSGDGGAE